MKKRWQAKKSLILAVITTILLCILSVFTILYFINPLLMERDAINRSLSKENLANVITVTNLKEIFTETKLAEPTSTEIIDFARFYNNVRGIHWDDITVDEASISEKNATLIANDSAYYEGSVTVQYTVNNIISLSNIFIEAKFDLGDIYLAPNTNITNDQILAKLAILVPQCDQQHVKLLNLNYVDNTVMLVGDNLKYQGSVTLTFTVQVTIISLDTKIITTDLGIIKSPWAKQPTSDQIIQAITAQPKNHDLDSRYIQINNITGTKARISGIGYYRGTVIVSYDLDMTTPLANHITVTELKTIDVSQADFKGNYFVNLLLTRVFDLNEKTGLHVLYFKAKDDTNINENSTSATIIPNSEKKLNKFGYTGQVSVTFKFNVLKT